MHGTQTISAPTASFPSPSTIPLERRGEARAFGPEAMVMAFARDEIVYLEEDPADYVFQVRSGLLKVYKLLVDGRRQITGLLFPGDLFGLQVDGLYINSVETVTSASVEALPRQRLEAAFDADPRLQRRFLAMFSNELVMAQEHILLLGRRTARERVAWFLLMLANRAGADGLSAPSVHLDLHGGEMADYLGLTTETVSRMLSQLKRDGMVRGLGSRRLQIVDLEALQGILDGE